MYNFQVEDKLQKILKKLAKKNSLLHQRILKKIEEIINSKNIEHYKNLKHGLKDYKRIHIGHFVLVFRFDKTNQVIFFDDLDNHDKIYSK